MNDKTLIDLDFEISIKLDGCFPRINANAFDRGNEIVRGSRLDGRGGLRTSPNENDGKKNRIDFGNAQHVVIQN
ncbi:MAG: hypothetical protein DWH91_10530 [Planctomycetota bacterium]|nr:MAG: hypothetical protein DWH91_10530 [Planctomycetota bacterium]